MEKANLPAAITSLVLGSGLRLLLFFVIPIELTGLDTMIPPVVSFVAFVSYSSGNTEEASWNGKTWRYRVCSPEQDVVAGEDLKGYISPSGFEICLIGGRGRNNEQAILKRLPYFLLFPKKPQIRNIEDVKEQITKIISSQQKQIESNLKTTVSEVQNLLSEISEFNDNWIKLPTIYRIAWISTLRMILLKMSRLKKY